ncbi:MAG: SDR family oxidoreductase [Acidobacteriota bacterium]|nr:SDR family oxidoreductase [Acidobacteriota bacterium]
MAGKVLIYGASGGIGEATARLLNERGFDLHLTGRSREKVAAVADEVGAGYTVGDIAEEDYFRRTAEEAGNSLEGLVYAVGTINLKPMRRLNADDFLEDFKINAMGAALAVQASATALKNSTAETGSVVLYSSIAARQGFTFHTSIGMAKGAINGLTYSLAAELAPNVRVNAIAPSLTDTPLAASIVANRQMADSIAGLHPIPRLGSADEIASMTAFLISEDSGWMTGQIIGVDGGRSTLRTSG